jgi:hypothetical protein
LCARIAFDWRSPVGRRQLRGGGEGGQVLVDDGEALRGELHFRGDMAVNGLQFPAQRGTVPLAPETVSDDGDRGGDGRGGDGVRVPRT